MKTGSIYKIKNKGYIIFGSSTTVGGFSIASEPFINIPEDKVNSDIIANAIKASLCNDDTKKVPDPTNWPEFNKKFLQNIGLKSLKELDSPTTKCVSISENKGEIFFLPTRPAPKPDKGFLHKNQADGVAVPTAASNQEIIVAYELSLSRCG